MIKSFESIASTECVAEPMAGEICILLKVVPAKSITKYLKDLFDKYRNDTCLLGVSA